MAAVILAETAIIMVVADVPVSLEAAAITTPVPAAEHLDLATATHPHLAAVEAVHLVVVAAATAVLPEALAAVQKAAVPVDAVINCLLIFHSNFCKP